GTIYYSNTAPASGSIKPNSINDNIVNIYSTSSPSDVRSVYGGYSDAGNVERNTVNIYGGTINNNVFGGYSYSGSSSANSNTVNI
ncbi:hypothetical protein, partial [Campylobacter fetus]|uniref:hypothetical protein n=1 Tax=Campylobacter fetus TaxID=196 RepID=UPI000828A3BC